MALTTASPQEVEHLRDRVRLYFLVMLLIDCASYVSDWVSPILFQESAAVELAPWFAFARHGVTVVLAGAWALLRFGRPNRAAIITLDSGLTFGLSLVYIHLSMAFVGDVERSFAPVFGAVGMMLLLSVRAALVPSSALRTFIVGAVPTACLWSVAAAELTGPKQLLLDGLTFMTLAFLFATAVTSRVIYGLRREVRDARRLGQYALRRKLGEGAMGVVYEATHVMLKRPTAVKLLPIEKAGEKTIARFEREVRQTSRLEHPNSVHVYDYGRTPDGQFYYAMEYLEGADLKQLVALGGPIGAPRVRHLLLQAANALAEAHDLGLVHRDIKPANIMICQRAGVPDTVKVLDFGLVKAPGDGSGAGITQANTIVGTPHYLAPETIRAPDDVGPPSDVYALGAVGFFLLTGRQVFTGESVIDVCAKHLHEAPAAPSEVLGRPLDAALEALIMRCLSKDAADRPADGAELARELEALVLPPWSMAEAHAWWSEFGGGLAAREEVDPTAGTMLAVDVHERS